MLRFILSAVSFFSLLGSCYANQTNCNLDRLLFNSIHFAENGNDIIIELHDIKKYLKMGANPNWINPAPQLFDNNTVLSHYVIMTWCVKAPELMTKACIAIRLLFEHGLRLQSPYDDGILFFAMYRNYELVKLLLENGVKADSWQITGTNLSPIEHATKKGYDDIVKLLIQHGAKEIDEKKRIQYRFIEVAGSGTISELEELFKKGARTNKKSKDDETALIAALINLTSYNHHDSLEKIIFLLKNGADPNAEGKISEIFFAPPLHAATLFTKNVNHTTGKTILQLLIDKGAFVSGEDRNGMTPLHYAAKLNNVNAASLFLDVGSKVMPRDNRGKTPLDYAKSGEIITLLKNYGAKEIY